MNNPLQHSGDENGSSSSSERDQSSGRSMSVSESESEMQRSRDQFRLCHIQTSSPVSIGSNNLDQTSDELESESKLEPESELKSESEAESESEPKPESEPSPPSSRRATERGGTNSDFTLENFLFEAQLCPGDVEEGKITLSQTAADHFTAEAGTSWRQPHLLVSDCDKKAWPMNFKYPPVEYGRLGLIGLKTFVAAHNLQPPDLIRFHKPAKPLQINHYLVDCVRIRPRTAPQPAIRIGNDGGDDDDDNSGGGRKRGDGEPNSGNRDKGKGVDCARTRSVLGGRKRGESSGSDKGKGVITGEKLEISFFDKKQLTEKDVVGPSMEKPISLILQADLWKYSGVLVFSDDRNGNWFAAFEFVM